jgi:ATP-binding cassette subfamily B protein RaxB
VILDPQPAPRVPWAKLGDHFTGVALELEPTATFRRSRRACAPAVGPLDPLSRFKECATQVVILSLALQFTALLAPLYIQTVVDEGLTGGRRRAAHAARAGLRLHLHPNAVIRALRGWVIVTLGQSLSYDMAGMSCAT